MAKKIKKQKQNPQIELPFQQNHKTKKGKVKTTKKAKSKKQKEEKRDGALHVRLFAPGMTDFHKVGLAGLYMTLQALEQDPPAIERIQDAGGSWECTETSVTLRWTKGAQLFFFQLFQESFRIDKNGLIWFPALGEPIDNIEHAIALQKAVLGTILQHTKTRTADPSQKPQGLVSYQVNDQTIPVEFHKISYYVHQDNKGKPFEIDKPTNIAGWAFPGGSVRHTAMSGPTSLQEPPERNLALRYAIVGCIFFQIRARGAKNSPRFAIVIPECKSLEQYALARQCFVPESVQSFQVAGPTEAGLQVLQKINAFAELGLSVCRVLPFGIVPWNEKQKTRMAIQRIRLKQPQQVLRIFALCKAQQSFQPKLRQNKAEEYFWSIPQTPEIIANNLTRNKRWWEGFANEFIDETRRQAILSEKGGLQQMIQNLEATPDSPERVFIQACHEAWRRRLGQLSDRAQRENLDFSKLINKEFEKYRTLFSRCKNATSIRSAVTDFWARSGSSLAPLQTDWHQVLFLFNEKNWRFARDLALLSLVSYPPKKQNQETTA